MRYDSRVVTHEYNSHMNIHNILIYIYLYFTIYICDTIHTNTTHINNTLLISTAKEIEYRLHNNT